MTADPIGGVWTYALELASAFHRHGVEVALATMGRRLGAEERAAAREVPGLRLFETAYRLEWMRDPWRDIQAAGRWLLELERELAPDIVHLNAFAHGALDWRAPVLVAGHSCVASWYRAVRKSDPLPLWDVYRESVRRGLAAAAIVAAPTRAMLSELAALYGPFRRSAVVYNGAPSPARPRAEKRPFVLTAGRLWDEAKNVLALDAIADRLSWPVYAAGPTASPDGEGVRLAAIRQLGPLPSAELSRWLERAAIFALPARYEPFGLLPLEAALAGCALVLGDIPSLRELWEEAAVFVNPEDREGLAAAIETLARDRDLRLRLGEVARSRALAFTPERMARGYLALYRRLGGAPGEQAEES